LICIAEFARSGKVLKKHVPIQFKLRESVVELFGHAAVEDEFFRRQVCND
jgi:hypothetical protein